MRVRRWAASATACCALMSVFAPAAATPVLADTERQPAAATPRDEGQHDELRQRLKAVPGLTVVGERPTEEGFRFFDLTYTQPVDHRKPGGEQFEQRLTLLHRGFDRPTVGYTTGYYVPEEPYRAEPTKLLDGNQLSMEYRFFEPSRPQPADWNDLDIWQAATDEHRVIRALKAVYNGEWLRTGQSKGGMSAIYHRRYYPHDVAGTIAYVAPNDVDNDEDAAYDDFFAEVGTPECRDKLTAVQREVLLRRDEMLAKYKEYAKEHELTFERMPGGIDQALEGTVLDTAFAFWQYQGMESCPTVPAADAPTQKIWAFVEEAVGFDAYADQGLDEYVPYYYQAATELGWPAVSHEHLDDLLRHDNDQGPSAYLPDEIETRFDPSVMRDVDRWVRREGSELMFINGSADPWAAEPFRLGKGTEDSSMHVVEGGNHGAEINQLPPAERDKAVSTVRRWGGVGDESTHKPVHIPSLDERPIPRHPL